MEAFFSESYYILTRQSKNVIENNFIKSTIKSETCLTEYNRLYDANRNLPYTLGKMFRRPLPFVF